MTLIAWSGGLDSSLVLHDVLSHWYGNNKSWPGYELNKDHYSPRTFNVECTQFNEIQMNMQDKARQKQKRMYNRKHWVFDDTTIKIDYGGHINGTFCQPFLFLSVASMIILDKEPLFLGWIKGDDADKHFDYFKDLWIKLTTMNGKVCPIHTPYKFHHKYEIVRKSKDLNIYNKSWWCECPIKSKRDTIKECKHCDSCLSMIGAEAISKHLISPTRLKKSSSPDKTSRVGLWD